MKEESVLRNEDRFSIFTNDTETWLSMTDGYDAIKNNKMSDFHTFWKGEGNAKSIRETRGIFQKYLFHIIPYYYNIFIDKVLAMYRKLKRFYRMCSTNNAEIYE